MYAGRRAKRHIIGALAALVTTAVAITGVPAVAAPQPTAAGQGARPVLPKPKDAPEGSPATSKVRTKADATFDATVQAGNRALAVQKAQVSAAATAPGVPEAPTPTGSTVEVAPAVYTGDSAAAVEQAALAAAPATGDVKNGRGDYSATPLAASSSWSAGGSSGSFDWTYPIAAPEVPAGPAPELTMAYSSASIDGRLPNTNNQPSWVGEGWEFANSYIERSYNSCKDDGQTGKYDLCWKTWNASMVLNGKSTELVKDDASGAWKLKDDDSSKVELMTESPSNNSDFNGEHWRVTTSDGTEYNFGLNKLPGADATRTNSTWSVPVFGDDSGEPCYTSTTFNSNACMQAWKWNLDYVVDRNGNAMTLWYQHENNMYFKSGTTTTGATYQRGGYLLNIKYGLRSAALFANSGYKVTFGVAERCLAADCSSLTSTTKAKWPDVPYDSICTSGSCSGKTSPTFFTRKRLTTVTTSTWNAALATPAFQDVDAYTIAHAFLDPGDLGDSTDQSLWVTSIQRTGKAGTTAIAMPKTTFGHTFLPNRVDGVKDGIIPLNKPRIASITTDTGASSIITYTPAQCTTTSKPTPDTNTSRCYPTYWYPNGTSTATIDWFHRYPVASVTVDAGEGSPAMTTSYGYTGGMAWHYDDSPLTVNSRRTWSQARGYGQVTTYVGAAGAGRSKTVSYFLRGMNGDKTSTGTRTVNVAGLKSTAIADSDQYAGFLREQVTYLGDTTTTVSGTINKPWSRQTSTHANTGGLAATKGYLVNTEQAVNWTTVTAKPDRIRTTTSTFDTEGFPVTVDDTGDPVSGGATCTINTYGRNASANILDTVIRTQVLGTTCASRDNATLPADTSTTGDVVSDTLTLFDSPTGTWSSSQAPTAGNPSWEGRVRGYNTDRSPIVGPGTRTLFDATGRPTTVTDPLGRATQTVYVPAAAFPTTRTTVTPPLLSPGTTTDFDPRSGGAVRVTDPNGKVTEQTYDALRRLTGVWLPTSSKAGGAAPDAAYAYRISNAVGDPSSIATTTTTTTGTITGTATSYTFYDGLLRPIQTQSPTPIGGRLVSDTFFDDQGRTYAAMTGVWDSGAPAATRFNTFSSTATSQTLTTYDGAGRESTSTFISLGVTKYTTTSTYTGESVKTTAPTGGAAAEVFTDALGRVTRRVQYAGTQPSGTSVQTVTTYDSTGRQDTVTGPGGAVWSYDYDLYGRLRTSTDPDSGQSQFTYDDADQGRTTKDARGVTITTTYDALGRPSKKYSGDETSGKLLAAWSYDTVAGGKGRLASSTSYVGSAPGVPGKAYSKSITGYDAEYNITGSSITLPADDPFVLAGVPATTTYGATYSEGAVATSTQPAIAGQVAESFTHSYSALTKPNKISNGTTDYLASAYYTYQGEPETYRLKTSATAPVTVYIDNIYDDATRRLATSNVSASTKAWPAARYSYTYDDAGNLKALKDVGTNTGTNTGVADTQCFTYDGYRRLDVAWTPNSGNCSDAPTSSAGAIGGPAPYWHEYDHNDDGSRAKLVEHATTVTTSTTTYSYGGTGKPAHSLAAVTGGPAAGTYAYNEVGATTSRPGPNGAQSLAWDDLGRLEKTTQPVAGGGTQDTGMIYDADGNLLIRRNTAATGESVLYLGDTEVKLAKNAGVTKPLTSQRYYGVNGQTLAVRTATAGVSTTSLTYLAGDNHGTAHVTLDAATATIAKRYTAPFGARRDASTSWVDDKGFLGKTDDDTTGLTHIGAREYDPVTGRFISVDPILDLTDLQSLNGYYYGDGNPGTFSDPDGQKIIDDVDGQGNATQYVKPSSNKKHQKVVKTRSYYRSRNSGRSRSWSSNARVRMGMRAWAAARNPNGSYSSGNGLGAPSIKLADAYPAVPYTASASDVGHFALDAAGLIPGIGEGADGINGLWYLQEGDYGNAALSGGAMVPFLGYWATGAKYGAKAVKAGDAGSFAGLQRGSVVGDGLDIHHMPQAAAGFTSRAEGGAIAIPHELHAQTRTYGARGVASLKSDSGLSFRQVLARDIADLRSVGGSDYNQGILGVLDYYKANFPELMAR